jgi:hypothetical protein
VARVRENLERPEGIFEGWGAGGLPLPLAKVPDHLAHYVGPFHLGVAVEEKGVPPWECFVSRDDHDPTAGRWSPRGYLATAKVVDEPRDEEILTFDAPGRPWAYAIWEMSDEGEDEED